MLLSLRMSELTYGLIHALHANIFIQLSARILRSWQTGNLELQFKLRDVTHAFLEFERSEGRERKTDDDDGTGEGVRKIDTFRELGTNDG